MQKNKRANRKCEFALSKIEALSYTDLLFGGSYDAKGIYNNWNKVLHNQFHDIIRGSSIKEVYDGNDKDYAEILGYTDSVADEKLGNITNRLNTNGGTLVYNPLGFERKGIAELNGKTVELCDTIPAFGWKVVNNFTDTTDVRINGFVAENKFYKMTLDNSGRIVELFDKTADREVLKCGEFANEFQAFEDMPRVYENWELTDYYKQKKWTLDETAEIAPITDGSRAGFKVVKKYFDSEIRQDIWL